LRVDLDAPAKSGSIGQLGDNMGGQLGHGKPPIRSLPSLPGCLYTPFVGDYRSPVDRSTTHKKTEAPFLAKRGF